MTVGAAVAPLRTAPDEWWLPWSSPDPMPAAPGWLSPLWCQWLLVWKEEADNMPWLLFEELRSAVSTNLAGAEVQLFWTSAEAFYLERALRMRPPLNGWMNEEEAKAARARLTDTPRGDRFSIHFLLLPRAPLYGFYRLKNWPTPAALMELDVEHRGEFIEGTRYKRVKTQGHELIFDAGSVRDRYPLVYDSAWEWVPEPEERRDARGPADLLDAVFPNIVTFDPNLNAIVTLPYTSHVLDAPHPDVAHLIEPYPRWGNAMPVVDLEPLSRRGSASSFNDGVLHVFDIAPRTGDVFSVLTWQRMRDQVRVLPDPVSALRNVLRLTRNARLAVLPMQDRLVPTAGESWVAALAQYPEQLSFAYWYGSRKAPLLNAALKDMRRTFRAILATALPAVDVREIYQADGPLKEFMISVVLGLEELYLKAERQLNGKTDPVRQTWTDNAGRYGTAGRTALLLLATPLQAETLMRLACRGYQDPLFVERQIVEAATRIEEPVFIDALEQLARLRPSEGATGQDYLLQVLARLQTGIDATLVEWMQKGTALRQWVVLLALGWFADTLVERNPVTVSDLQDRALLPESG